jgi:hypothetical protein
MSYRRADRRDASDECIRREHRNEKQQRETRPEERKEAEKDSRGAPQREHPPCASEQFVHRLGSSAGSPVSG